MKLVRYTVSQVRQAASCPRIFFFDKRESTRSGKSASSTLLWLPGGDAGACGALFHNAVEAFNSASAHGGGIEDLLRPHAGGLTLQQRLLNHIYDEYVNKEALFGKSGESQRNFLAALEHYAGELADILGAGLAAGKTSAELVDMMFGDKRKNVDITFHVGPSAEPVEVAGRLDYVFYDWRYPANRIIDYKLTPGDRTSQDLFQVGIYALMHHQQHRTSPNAAVYYLHPEVKMAEMTWAQIFSERYKIYNFLASMREWDLYEPREKAGLKPPGEPVCCPGCKWAKVCVARLGALHEGGRCTHWRAESIESALAEPLIRFAPDANVAASVTAPPIAGRMNHSVNVHAETGAPSQKGEQPLNPPTLAQEEKPTCAGEPDAAQVAERLYIGQTSQGTPVCLPPQIITTHIAVVGAAGSGKTWQAKVIAEEAVLQGIPVIAIDPQGDLVQFLRQRGGDNFSGAQKERHRQYCGIVEPRVWTPGSSHGARLRLNPLRLAERGALKTSGSEARREEEYTDMLRAAASNLVALAGIGGEEESQGTFLYRLLNFYLERMPAHNVTLEHVAAACADPEGAGFDDADTFIKKSEREKLARKLKAIMHGPSSHLFTGGEDLDFSRMLRPAQDGRVPLNIIYLNALADDRQKHFFLALFAAELYQWMITTLGSSGKANLLFYIDEARDFIPAGSAKPPAKQPLIRLFTQGRKYGVSGLICTQSPRSVDYNVFGNCSTKIIGRLESAQDVDRVNDWFTVQGAPPSWVRDRKEAGKGTFVVRWPEMPSELEGIAFKGRQLYSLHEGAWTPDRLEQEAQESRS